MRTVKRSNPYRRWLVWQKAKALADEIHTVTNRFPDAEPFDLIPQMRRASLSIPANIASGFRHSVKREKRRCYRQAQVSLAALDAYLKMSRSPLRAVLSRIEGRRLAILQRDVDRLLKTLVHFVP
ncbi:MAG: four helix bundle protein [Candidatus Omnitrophica bacterium]|nr:four helix bundle protein [Candidatus Omnitrophota bacterium]